MASDTLYNRAAHLFRAFHNRKPRDTEIVDIRTASTVGLVVGELDGVIYRTEGEERGHIHRFNKRNRPVLIVSYDGSQAYILAGGYRFTDRGFIG